MLVAVKGRASAGSTLQEYCGLSCLMTTRCVWWAGAHVLICMVYCTYCMNCNVCLCVCMHAVCVCVCVCGGWGHMCLYGVHMNYNICSMSIIPLCLVYVHILHVGIVIHYAHVCVVNVHIFEYGWVFFRYNFTWDPFSLRLLHQGPTKLMQITHNFYIHIVWLQ